MDLKNKLKDFPRLASFLSKYDAIYEDIKSLSFFYILRKRSNSEFIPERLFICPTNFCNANCTYCSNRFLKDKRETMSFSMFKKIIDDYHENKKSGLIDLTPSAGEVLLDPGLFEKIAYAKSKGFQIFFYTNGILLENKLKDILLSNIEFLNIDLGDIIPEYDSKVFQIPLELSKKKLRGILQLIKSMDNENSKIKLILDFRCYRSPKEIMESLKNSEFYHYFRKGIFGVNFMQTFDNWAGAIKQKDLIGIQKLKNILVRTYIVLLFFLMGILDFAGAGIMKPKMIL